MCKYIILTIVVVSLVVFLFLRDKSPVSSSAEIVIKAPLNQVWDIQTDIADWPNWNHDIESMTVKGDVELGTVFIWKAGGVTIESKVVEFIPHQKIAWEGKTIGIQAYHVWTFSEENGKIHVYTEESFKGFLAWLLPGTMRNEISKALNHGVSILKQKAENAIAKE